MILRLWARLGLLLFIPLLAAVFIIRSTPYNEHPIRQFLLENGCRAPCFLGIRPGVTTAVEALVLLRTNDWVEARTIAYRDSDYGGGAVWSWTAEASPLLGAKQGGFVTSPRNGIQIVDLIHVTTTISSGDIYLALGTSLQTLLGETGLRDEAFMARFYPDHGISVWSNFLCPSLNDHIWKQPVMIQYRLSGSIPKIPPRETTC